MAPHEKEIVTLIKVNIKKLLREVPAYKKYGRTLDMYEHLISLCDQLLRED